MSRTFTFNGVSSADMGITMRRTEPPPLIPIALTTVHAPGRAGDWLMGVETLPLGLVIPVWVQPRTGAQRAAIAAWLSPKTPQELVFSAEPTKVYFGVFAGASDLWTAGSATLTFVCVDPYAYTAADDETALVTGANNVANGGDVETYPVLELTLDAASSFLEVVCEETGEACRLGQAASLEDTPTAPTTLVLADDCSSLSGWTESAVCEGGDSDPGTMAIGLGPASIGYGPGLSGCDFGTGSDLHGVTIIKALTGGPFDHFRLNVSIFFRNTTVANSAGRLEFYLLDSLDNIIGKIGVQDLWTTLNQVQWFANAGTADGLHPYIYSDINRNSAGPGAWNDILPGQMTLSRLNDIWTASIQKGFWQFRRTYRDPTAPESRPALAKVGIRVAKYGTRAMVERAEVTQVNVWELNEGAVPGPETYLFAAGDVVTMDMRQGEVLLNGSTDTALSDAQNRPVPLSAFLDFAAPPSVALPTGNSTLTITADESVGVTGTAYVRKRYL